MILVGVISRSVPVARSSVSILVSLHALLGSSKRGLSLPSVYLIWFRFWLYRTLPAPVGSVLIAVIVPSAAIRYKMPFWVNSTVFAPSIFASKIESMPPAVQVNRAPSSAPLVADNSVSFVMLVSIDVCATAIISTVSPFSISGALLNSTS